MSKQRRVRVGEAERAGANAASPTRSESHVGRFSVKKKIQAVLRVLHGESLESVSRDVGVTAAKLTQWRDQFLGGAQGALRSRPQDDRDEVVKDLQAKIGELTMANELLEEKIDHLEANRPWVRRRSRR